MNMMPRKKRKMIVIISILAILAVIIGMITFLAITTDLFYSKQTLFAKYIAENFSVIESYTEPNKSSIQQVLETNKYTSDLTAKVDYIENRSTSAESKENAINKSQLKIVSQVDLENQYDYKQIELVQENENLAKAEYVKQNDMYGVRLKGIIQFVSIQNTDLEELENKIGISKGTLENVLSLENKNEIFQILQFSEQEKQTIQNTYLGILSQMIPKDNYKKLSNVLITINAKEVKGNAYVVTVTKEQYNNMIIKILEKITEDEILLGKVDQLEKYLERFNFSSHEIELKEKLVKTIKEQITEIQNNNIGQEEIKITVYESNRHTVRTMIETPTQKTTLDLQDTGILLSNLTYHNNQQIEKRISINQKQEETEETSLLKLEELIDEEVTNSKQLEVKKTMENNKVTNVYTIQFLTEDNKATLTINETINIVNSFNNPIELSQENNIMLNELEKEKANNILQILQQQGNNITSKVNLEEIISMLKKIEILQPDAVKIEETNEVSEIERTRYNTKFEFFVGDNLNLTHIEQMMDVVKENLEEVEVVSSNELKLILKRDQKKEELAERALQIITDSKKKEFTVNMNYNEETKLIESITIKINDTKK